VVVAGISAGGLYIAHREQWKFSTECLDPIDCTTLGRIVNDTSRTVSVVQCGDSCTPDNWQETDILKPGQNVSNYMGWGFTNPWLVLRGGKVVGCLPMFTPWHDEKIVVGQVWRVQSVGHCS